MIEAAETRRRKLLNLTLVGSKFSLRVILLPWGQRFSMVVTRGGLPRFSVYL